jgi:CxxC-x17-CxxC domain-containing protein
MKSRFTTKSPKRRFTAERSFKYRVVCSRCGRETNVLFRPKMERPIYCKRCFAKIVRENRYAKEKAKREKISVIKNG